MLSEPLARSRLNLNLVLRPGRQLDRGSLTCSNFRPGRTGRFLPPAAHRPADAGGHPAGALPSAI
jgi:hypothetical protein